MKYLGLIIIIVIVVFAFYIYYKHFRPPKLGTFVMVTGGVKCGKSTTSVGASILDIRFRRWRIKFINWLRRLFRVKKPQIELPLYYSNVPVNTGFGYVPVTKELLLRKHRFVYGSVIYFQECSFLCGSMDYGVEEVDDAIKSLCKLVGHETKGGALYVDTQSVSDLHNGFRRSCSMELYVYKTVKVPLLPFLIVWYKQLYYNEDGQLVNVNSKNADDDLRKMLFFSKVWKRFDCYCYSILTDDLPVERRLRYPKTDIDFKAKEILQLKKILKQDYNKGVKNEKKKYT